MIVLDTDVLSEVMRAEPSPRVIAWLSAMEEENLYTSVVARAEILAGIALLPEGRRKALMAAVAERIFEEDFSGRVLAFENATVEHYAAIMGLRRSAGRSMRPLDAMIAAIARQRGAGLATRNIRDFEGCGIELHDPWRAV